MTRTKKLISAILSAVMVVTAAMWNLALNVSAETTLKIAYIDGTDVSVRAKASMDSKRIDRISNRSVTVIGTSGDFIKVKYVGNESDSNSEENYGKEVVGYIRNTEADYWVKISEYQLDADFETQLSKFPESYREDLKALHEKYPNWQFIPDYIDMSLSQAVALQDVGMRKQVQGDYISWRSMRPGSYDWDTGKWMTSNGGWYGASREIIAHYMDARNFLNENEIYMFLNQSYDMGVYTEAGLKKIVAGTFLADGYTDKNDTEYGGSYIKVIMEAGKQAGVSPYIIASKIIQEQGSKGTSSLISGNYNTTYKGYYNFFNFKASGDTNAEVITNGLKYAKSQGWNSRSASIIGGAKQFSLGYIENGQDTYFYQDFNIHFPESGLDHQYAQAVHDARSKGYSLNKFYVSDKNSALTFIIPVYSSVPTKKAAKPVQNSKLNNYYLNKLSISGLTPTFNRFTYSYDLKMTGDAIIEVKKPSTATLTSAELFNLKKGTNKVVIKVKSQSGYTRSYTISVNATKDCTLYVNKKTEASGGGNTEPEYKLGDINNDGKITVSDMANVKLHLLQKYVLTDTAFKAADINGDDKITVSDLANIKLHLLGKYTIK